MICGKCKSRDTKLTYGQERGDYECKAVCNACGRKVTKTGEDRTELIPLVEAEFERACPSAGPLGATQCGEVVTDG